MKNWEFYKEGLKKYEFDFALKDNQICSCAEVPCYECAFCMGEELLCDKAKVKWLYQDYKEPVVLTNDEKALCRLLSRGWIARDKDEELFWHSTIPTKTNMDWLGKNSAYMSIYTIFPQCKFNFIKWEDDEPWEVKIDG